MACLVLIRFQNLLVVLKYCHRVTHVDEYRWINRSEALTRHWRMSSQCHRRNFTADQADIFAVFRFNYTYDELHRETKHDYIILYGKDMQISQQSFVVWYMPIIRWLLYGSLNNREPVTPESQKQLLTTYRCVQRADHLARTHPSKNYGKVACYI